MSPRDAVDDLMDRFGARLEEADHRADRGRRPRRVRRLVIAGAGLAAAGSVAVLAIGPIGGDTRLDVVGEARAALAPEGTILHMKIAYGRLGEPDDPSSKEIRESWSATDPLRWKFTQVTPYVIWKDGKSRSSGRYQTEEFAFAGGTMSDFNQRQNTLTTMAGYDPSGPESAPLTWPGMPAGKDPAAALRSLLASGGIRSAGETTLGGRAVLRLRGMSAAQEARGIPAMPVEYDVDRRTFAPVRMVITMPAGDASGSEKRSSAVVWFRAFERLPMTPANEALLTVRPAADTKISRFKLPAKGEPCEKRSRYDNFCIA